MKYLLIFLISIVAGSCSDSFVNHSLKYEKIGACIEQRAPVKISTNISGERYEFTRCLDADFDGKNYSVERSGDSILVHFPKQKQDKALFLLTLDIDAKPAYRHIILDSTDILITQQ